MIVLFSPASDKPNRKERGAATISEALIDRAAGAPGP